MKKTTTTYIYSYDGCLKVDIDAATLLGDVSDDLGINQQGDNSQLWRSKSGNYFKGLCLDHARGRGGIVKYSKFIPVSKDSARDWVLKYYGAGKLARFGFADKAKEI